MKSIRPAKRLFGEITLPGDKSISHRALLVGAIARGETNARFLLDCDDCCHTAVALKKMLQDEKEHAEMLIKEIKSRIETDIFD